MKNVILSKKIKKKVVFVSLCFALSLFVFSSLFDENLIC